MTLCRDNLLNVKKKLTLWIEQDLIKLAKHKAVDSDLSLSLWIEKLVSQALGK